MAVIREHLAAKGLGLFNDLQNEHSIVGNNPFVLMIRDFGRPDQQHLIPDMLDRHAFRLDLRADGAQSRLGRHLHGDPRRPRRASRRAGWRIDGEKMWTTGMHAATPLRPVRPHQRRGWLRPRESPAFLVPAHAPGVKIEEYLWTFNMPTDHPGSASPRCGCRTTAMLGPEDGGLAWPSTSCTRTASARRPPAWARRPTA